MITVVYGANCDVTYHDSSVCDHLRHDALRFICDCNGRTASCDWAGFKTQSGGGPGEDTASNLWELRLFASGDIVVCAVVRTATTRGPQQSPSSIALGSYSCSSSYKNDGKSHAVIRLRPSVTSRVKLKTKESVYKHRKQIKHTLGS